MPSLAAILTSEAAFTYGWTQAMFGLEMSAYGHSTEMGDRLDE